MQEQAIPVGTHPMKGLRIVGLVILIVVVAVFALNFAIKIVGPPQPRFFVLGNTVTQLSHGYLGFWLTGDVVTTPVTDWSFTDSLPTVHIETRTWYLLPHSVITLIGRNGSQLFLGSEYGPPRPGQEDLRDRFPEARFWNRMVLRDPRIRLKIGNQIYQMRAYPVYDPSLDAVALASFLSKYDSLPVTELGWTPGSLRRFQAYPAERRPKFHFFRLEQGW